MTAGVWCAVTIGSTLALMASECSAQLSTWRADLPASLPPREAVVVQQLAQRLEGMASPVRIEVVQDPKPSKQSLQNSRTGVAQLTLVPVSILSTISPEFAVFDSLFLFQSLDQVDRYTSSIEGRRLLDSLKKQGLRGLGFVHGGMVQIVARNPLNTSSDFKGLKVARMLESDSIARQFAALGASTTVWRFGEAYQALQMGAIDAVEVGWPEMASYLNDSSGLAVFESNHRYRGYVLVANDAAFAKLGWTDQRQLFADVEAVIDSHNTAVKIEENKARGKLLENQKTLGGVTQPDYDAVYPSMTKSGWTQKKVLQHTIASAFSVNSLDLAHKYYGSVAPKAPPKAAIRYAMHPLSIDKSISGDGVATDSEATVVYNADLTPQLPRDKSALTRPVLRAGQLATFLFDIGPRWASSVLSNAIPSSEILGSKEDVPLTVVLSCGFCEPHADSMRRMTFRPDQGRSEKIRFQFTPKPGRDGVGYIAKLQLAIINDKTGREYDRLVVTVAIVGDGAAVAKNLSGALVFAPSKGSDLADWQPDVLLYANAEMDRNVTLAIQPVSAEMKKLLSPLALDAQGVRKVFRSGIDDPTLIEAMTNSAYGAMSAVSMQGEFLKRLSATGTDAFVSKASQDSLELSATESSNVAGVIAETGQRLYRHLFYRSADTDLRKIIHLLEAAAAGDEYRNRPLRMTVITNRLSLPWQYLHPVGPKVDAGRFWGMQFSLSVLRVSTNAREKAVAPGMEQARKFVFAHYGSSADPTVPLATRQVAQLLSLPLAQTDLLKVDTGADLLGQVSAQRKQIAGILTFLHASAGSADTVPHLQFNDGDLLTSDKLEDLKNKVAEDEQDLRYLAGAPLVILNACETGPSRNLPHVKLENAMFELGARGVVVTEVSVWISLGHEVATQLITRLINGEPVSDALTAIRRTLLQKKKNPLGLLYVYYGDPSATFRR